MKIYYLTMLCVISFALLGCQQTPVQQTANVQTTQSPVAKEDNSAVKRKLPCFKGTTPLIKDTSKVKKLLLSSGKITTQMTQQEVNKIIQDYIKKKRDALNNCKK